MGSADDGCTTVHSRAESKFDTQQQDAVDRRAYSGRPQSETLPDPFPPTTWLTIDGWLAVTAGTAVMLQGTRAKEVSGPRRTREGESCDDGKGRGLTPLGRTASRHTRPSTQTRPDCASYFPQKSAGGSRCSGSTGPGGWTATAPSGSRAGSAPSACQTLQPRTESPS